MARGKHINSSPNDGDDGSLKKESNESNIKKINKQTSVTNKGKETLKHKHEYHTESTTKKSLGSDTSNMSNKEIIKDIQSNANLIHQRKAKNTTTEESISTKKNILNKGSIELSSGDTTNFFDLDLVPDSPPQSPKKTINIIEVPSCPFTKTYGSTWFFSPRQNITELPHINDAMR